MTFLWCLSPYNVWRLCRLLIYDVCRLMTLVAYDVYRLMTFVTYDVCHLWHLSLMTFVTLWRLSHYYVCRIMMFVAYWVCCITVWRLSLMRFKGMSLMTFVAVPLQLITIAMNCFTTNCNYLPFPCTLYSLPIVNIYLCHVQYYRL